ncbi:hypothetical protein MIZ03_0559 [Rhodoferax lithotrophicus]|uniref:Uncharacterized protein n=1 Tax=Rhodoferax lithotrophicus TaxID=2798804 RepID=A0ABN6D144_9BURK|nr:hypothetical protein MIZ03_0559 [Rhodoferax sp. MIZ03]
MYSEPIGAGNWPLPSFELVGLSCWIVLMKNKAVVLIQ